MSSGVAVMVIILAGAVFVIVGPLLVVYMICASLTPSFEVNANGKDVASLYQFVTPATVIIIVSPLTRGTLALTRVRTTLTV